MADALADLEQLRGHLDDSPLAALSGRFHSHLTVLAGEADLPRLTEVCRAHRAKTTVIDLEGFGPQHQRDVMATRYHADPDPGAVGRIVDDLLALCAALAEAGLPVVRAKIEHESEPSLPRFSEQAYHEVHVKLRIEASAYEEAYAWLAAQADRFGWRPSRNPLERRGDRVTQFVNLRIYEGDRASADAIVARIEAALRERGLEIVEIKRETAILDTHRGHDAWWA